MSESKLVEAIAQAISAHEPETSYWATARLVLAAIDAAGWQLVPKGPTKEMIEAAYRAVPVAICIPRDVAAKAVRRALAVAPKPE